MTPTRTIATATTTSLHTPATTRFPSSDNTSHMSSQLEPLCRAMNHGALLLSQGAWQQGSYQTEHALHKLAPTRRRPGVTAPPRPMYSKDLRVTPLRCRSDDQKEPVPPRQPVLGSAFLCPFLVDPHATFDTYEGVLGVAYFNMAMARHAAALQLQQKQGTSHRHFYLLQQARELYLQAHAYLEEDPAMIQMQGTLIYVYTAICNNVAEINLELGLTASHWIEALASTVAGMPENSESRIYKYFQLRSACLMLPINVAGAA